MKASQGKEHVNAATSEPKRKETIIGAG